MSWFTNYQHRRLEWALSTCTVTLGAVLLWPAESMGLPIYGTALRIMGESDWGLLYFIVGSCHIIALHINGRAAWTPFVRLAALFLNSQVFLALSLGLAHVNAWSVGAFIFGYLATVFCGMAIWAAAQDCGREFAIWRRRHERNKP